ncbi:MAG: anaerobic ribonucleoside-triphosphate reductase activating protein [Muribaculum sp.]|nr:anaerobic ribonucleoside-triphosphate reductase activating protein [Muribaculaceae bacterium]MCM1081461.1 anaerobic ribonucleoside-triphosphate reductase activating protein [Muribaculum sp.]
MEQLRVIDIIEGTTVDGPGLRTAIYFAGCSHQCPGCHNPQSWPFDAGRDIEFEKLMALVDEATFNVTFTGGDPMLQSNTAALTRLAELIKKSGKTLWCFTGFTYEQLVGMPHLQPLLNQIDVLVDGPFIESRRDISLRFRGSDNQRIINIPATRSSGVITPWDDTF